MPTNATNVLNLEDTGVQDWIAVQGGVKVADRAKARGVSSQTVTRNVSTVQAKVDAGWTLPQGNAPEGVTVAPASPYAILNVDGVMDTDATDEDREDAKAFVDMVRRDADAIGPKVRRVQDALDALAVAMASGDGDRVARMARRFGVNLEAFRVAQDDHGIGIDVPTYVQDALNAHKASRAEGATDEGAPTEDAPTEDAPTEDAPTT